MAANLPLPIPSKDPADQHSLPGVLEAVFKKQMQGVQGQLPAVVISYDRDTNLAVVQPMIAILTTDGKAVSRAPVASVPALALGGGGFVLNFPLKQGDKGWIEASDRDISLYLQGGGNEAQPNTARLHSFEDGRFIPDAFAQYVIAGEDAAACVLQSLDGSVRIALDPSGAIRLTSATILLTATTSVAIATPLLDLSEVTQVVGGADLEFGGIKFGTHEHANGTLPGGKTAGPSNP